jgi:hypothetical protein
MHRSRVRSRLVQLLERETAPSERLAHAAPSWRLGFRILVCTASRTMMLIKRELILYLAVQRGVYELHFELTSVGSFGLTLHKQFEYAS